MRFLVCNDDGYFATGISVMAKALDSYGSVRVVAPERDRSAVSNSLTLDRPLSLKKAANGFYFVNGTPTDCVHLALHTMPDFVPDMLFSGINHGANMGDDTLYSGTVAAATEAFLLGIPAVAFSLHDKTGQFFGAASKIVELFAKFFIKTPPTQPLLWNVNIPGVPYEDLKGVKITRLGKRHHAQSIIPTTNPRGEELYWIGPAGAAADAEEGTDFWGSANHYVTVTPLSIDLTNYDQLPYVGQSLCALKL